MSLNFSNQPNLIGQRLQRELHTRLNGKRSKSLNGNRDGAMRTGTRVIERHAHDSGQEQSPGNIMDEGAERDVKDTGPGCMLMHKTRVALLN